MIRADGSKLISDKFSTETIFDLPDVFGEYAELPTNLGSTERRSKPARKLQEAKPKKTSARPVDNAAERKAVSPSNGSRTAGIANGTGKRRLDRRCANASKRPSPEPKQRWARPSENMRRKALLASPDKQISLTDPVAARRQRAGGARRAVEDIAPPVSVIVM